MKGNSLRRRVEALEAKREQARQKHVYRSLIEKGDPPAEVVYDLAGHPVRRADLPTDGTAWVITRVIVDPAVSSSRGAC